MNKVIAANGKACFYAQNDGTGRDTYVSFNQGGNTLAYEPNAKGITNGQLRNRCHSVAMMNLHIQAKTPHYNQNGSGRDTYILDRHGGFNTDCDKLAPALAHVQSLRTYESSIKDNMNLIARHSRRQDCDSPTKDYLVEGQASIRHPDVARSIERLAGYQSTQSRRLSIPAKLSESPFKRASSSILNQVPSRVNLKNHAKLFNRFQMQQNASRFRLKMSPRAEQTLV